MPKSDPSLLIDGNGSRTCDVLVPRALCAQDTLQHGVRVTLAETVAMFGM